MSTQVQLPDGSRVTVQTDDPKAAASAARKHWETRQAATPAKLPQAPPSVKRRTWDQTLGDAIGDISDNMLPNWGDEIYAAGAAARALVDGDGVGQAFTSARQRFKRNQSQYDKEHSKLAIGTTAGGIVVGLAAPAGKVAKGASVVQKVAHSGAVGAAYGAFSGAGKGATWAERGANALHDAKIGAAIGAAAQPLISGARRVGNLAMRYVPGAETAVRTLERIPRAVLAKAGIGKGPAAPGDKAKAQAERMLATQMQKGHIEYGRGQFGPASSPEAVAAEVQRRAAIGVPAMPADTTDALRNTASWASRGTGPGQTRVREALAERKATEAARVRQHVADTMGPVVDPIQQVEEISKRASQNAKPMYEEAYAKPMLVTPEISEIMKTPAFGEAVPDAVRNIRNAMRDPEAMGLRLVPHPKPGEALPPNLPHVVTPEGVLILDKGLSTEAYDQVIRAMRDRGRAAADVNPITGRVNNTTNSVHINARAGDLKGQLADQNPAYRDVTAMYADEMAQRDAMIRGKDVGTLSGPEIQAQARAMPDNAMESWSVGARSALADEASKYGAKFQSGDTANQVRKALGDGTKQDAIGQMMGNNGQVRNLQERLAAESRGNATFAEVHGNSRTAARQQLDNDLDEAAGGGGVSASLKGLVVGAWNHLVAKATPQFRQDIKARIAEILTETNPQTVQELMAAVASRAERDAEFAGLLHKSGIIGTKAAAMNIAPPGDDTPIPEALRGSGYDEDAVAQAVAEAMAGGPN